MSGVRAVIFDLDGVLLDSETVWDEARRAFVEACGGRWLPNATTDMMGMSSHEWSAYMHDRLGVPVAPERISVEVAASVDERYRGSLPLLPGAREAVRRLAAHWPLGLASSANRTIIERFLDASGLRASFAASVSSEEVDQGKPAPDVYRAAADALGVGTERCVAIEDSTNGLRSAAAAGTQVIALPNPHFPPSPDALALARFVARGLDDLTVEAIEALAEPTG
jgi:HAD superfamily hydrolase (TIGR01509 family)